VVRVARMSQALGGPTSPLPCSMRRWRRQATHKQPRILNIEHVLTRSACYIMVYLDAYSYSNDHVLKSAWQ
jgi:hypothetical protein